MRDLPKRKITRRAALQAGVAGMVGLGAGAAAEYLTRPTELSETTTTQAGSVGRPPPPTEKVTIASLSTTPVFYTLPDLLTVENLNNMGYNAEYAFLGGQGATAAFLSGEAQLISNASSTIMPAIEQGADVILIGPDTPLGYVLVASTDVKSLMDLEGKTIGISRPGALEDVIPRFLLKNSGVDVNRVTWVAIGSSPQRVPALVAGRIDASLLLADVALQVLNETDGNFHILARVSDVAPGLVPDGVQLFAYRDWAAKNAQVVEDILRARILTEAWVVNNKDEFVSQAASEILGKSDESSTQFYGDVYDLYRSNGWLPYLSVDPDSVKLQLSLAKEAGTIKGTVQFEEFYEPKYLAEVFQHLLEYEPTA